MCHAAWPVHMHPDMELISGASIKDVPTEWERVESNVDKSGQGAAKVVWLHERNHSCITFHQHWPLGFDDGW